MTDFGISVKTFYLNDSDSKGPNTTSKPDMKNSKQGYSNSETKIMFGKKKWDCELRSDKERFGVQKSVLKEQSPIFKNIIKRLIKKEGKQESTIVIEILGVGQGAVHAMLYCMYNGLDKFDADRNPSVLNKNLSLLREHSKMDVARLALYFELGDLAEFFRKDISYDFNSKSIYQWMEIAIERDLKWLVNEIQKYVRRNRRNIKDSKELKECFLKNPKVAQIVNKPIKDAKFQFYKELFIISTVFCLTVYIFIPRM